MGAPDRNCWATPLPFFAGLHEEYNFELDVCALPDTAKCSLYFTPKEDGLRQSWAMYRCFCNPPYSDIEPWAAKAYHESQRGALVAMLVPTRTDAKWWHRYALRATELLWVVGRVKFVPPPGIEASTPCESSVVVVWTPPTGTRDDYRGMYQTTIDAASGLQVKVRPEPEQLAFNAPRAAQKESQE